MNTLYQQAPWLPAVARVFHQAGAPLYAVGGAVRNPLMGLPVSDIDLCGPLTPEAVVQLCKGTAVRAHLRVAHFGTVELHVADQGGRFMAEYTTFRFDSYRCGHRPEAVRFTMDMAVDARRRDFSVNALYRPLGPEAPGEVIDPTGGLQHLAAGELHAVDDPLRVLGEDGLRILRMARFQAELGLTPAPELLAAAKAHAGLLTDIVPERKAQELQKLMLGDGRYPALARQVPGVTSALETLRVTGAFPLLFPALWYDSLAAAALPAYQLPDGVDALAGRFALLFYAQEPSRISEGLAALRFPVKVCQQAQELARVTRGFLCGRPTLFASVQNGVPALCHAESALYALRGVIPAYTVLFSEVNRMLRTMIPRSIPKSLKELALSGDDLKALCSGPRLGALLTRLWQAVVEGKVKNEREALLREAQRVLLVGEDEKAILS